MNLFREKIRAGDFVITCELSPPKGAGLEKTLSSAVAVKGLVDAVNVTDSHAAVMRAAPLALSLRLKEMGIEPVMQINCRDRNRLALQADLLAAASLGIENVLVLTGDHPFCGDHRGAKPVFDLDAVQLLKVIGGLRSGFDMQGNRLSGEAPDIFPGAAVNPQADPPGCELAKMRKKIAAGAEFFQSQAVFDAESFIRFREGTKDFYKPLIAGILPLRSAAQAHYFTRAVPGVSVPEGLIALLDEQAGNENTLTDFYCRLIREIKPFCSGIHIMPGSWRSILPELVKAAGEA